MMAPCTNPPKPYWVSIVTIVLIEAVLALPEMAKCNCCRKKKENGQQENENGAQPQDNAMIEIEDNKKDNRDVRYGWISQAWSKGFFGKVSVVITLVQLLISLVSFLTTMITTDYSHSRWINYETLWSSIIQSSFYLTWISLMPNNMADMADMSIFWVLGFVVFAGLLVMPAALSHIMPGMLMYAWISLPILVGVKLAMERAELYRKKGCPLIADLIFEVLYKYLIVALMQSAFEWARLIYHGNGYIKVLQLAWKLRSTDVYFDSLFCEAGNYLDFINTWLP